jgi:hypothetical protein
MTTPIKSSGALVHGICDEKTTIEFELLSKWQAQELLSRFLVLLCHASVISFSLLHGKYLFEIPPSQSLCRMCLLTLRPRRVSLGVAFRSQLSRRDGGRLSPRWLLLAFCPTRSSGRSDVSCRRWAGRLGQGEPPRDEAFLSAGSFQTR